MYIYVCICVYLCLYGLHLNMCSWAYAWVWMCMCVCVCGRTYMCITVCIIVYERVRLMSVPRKCSGRKCYQLIYFILLFLLHSYNHFAIYKLQLYMAGDAGSLNSSFNLHLIHNYSVC